LRARVFSQFVEPARPCDRAAASSRPILGSPVQNAIWVQCRPHPADAMSAAELAHNRRERRPRSGRVADDGKHGNVRRKVDHKEPDSEAARKVPAGTAGVRSSSWSCVAILLQRIGAPKGRCGGPARPTGEAADQYLRAPKGAAVHSTRASADSLYSWAILIFVLYMFMLANFRRESGFSVSCVRQSLKSTHRRHLTAVHSRRQCVRLCTGAASI
jgi:hypothetical protein